MIPVCKERFRISVMFRPAPLSHFPQLPVLPPDFNPTPDQRERHHQDAQRECTLGQSVVVRQQTAFRQNKGNQQKEPKRRRRKPLLDEKYYALLRGQVLRQPGTPMVELGRLLEAQGKRVSGTTVSKALKEMGCVRKKRQKAPFVPAPQTPPRYRDIHRREPTSSTYPSSLTDRS